MPLVWRFLRSIIVAGFITLVLINLFPGIFRVRPLF
jgi:hypothetical protein